MQMEDELDMECELERELAAEQEELLEEAEEELAVQQAIEMALDQEKQQQQGKKSLSKVLSLPANFTFSTPRGSLDMQDRGVFIALLNNSYFIMLRKINCQKFATTQEGVDKKINLIIFIPKV